jgi:hypothetical protein
MLEITIPGLEYFNEETNEFTYYDDVTIELEHSLVSISKWESNWCKPFLDGKDKTMEEIIDYVKCMTITDKVDEDTYNRLTEGNLIAINDYIGRPMTATTFREEKKPGWREIITSEIIYYWMVSYNIPFECQYWHLNRLLTLVKVCNVKNNPPKKMSQQEILARNKALNDARRKQYGTRG